MLRGMVDRLIRGSKDALASPGEVSQGEMRPLVHRDGVTSSQGRLAGQEG